MKKNLPDHLRKFKVITTLTLIAVIFLGCGGGGGGSSSTNGGGGGSPEIALSREEIVFGNIAASLSGLRFSDRAVQVSNIGSANLTIGQIDRNLLTAPFSIFEDNCSGTSLAPNGLCSVVVRFQPTDQGSFSDSFNIPSDDLDEASVSISLSGIGQGLKVTIMEVDTSNYNQIKMLVSVTDGDNNVVTNLALADFMFSESGLPKKFFNSVASTVRPLTTVQTLDYSGSIINSGAKGDVESAAKSFFSNLQDSDEAAVIKFAVDIDLIRDFTILDVDGRVALEAAIDAPYTPLERGTRFLDAAYDSVERLGQRDVLKRRASIILSDGVDFKFPEGTALSTSDLDDVIANAKEKTVSIYTIGFGSSIETAVMSRMADETGGDFLVAPSAADLNAIYLNLARILNNQYELIFTASRPDGTSNSINVFVNNGSQEGDNTVSIIY